LMKLRFCNSFYKSRVKRLDSLYPDKKGRGRPDIP
jgi:hypothetical protein